LGRRSIEWDLLAGPSFTQTPLFRQAHHQGDKVTPQNDALISGASERQPSLATHLLNPEWRRATEAGRLQNIEKHLRCHYGYGSIDDYRL